MPSIPRSILGHEKQLGQLLADIAKENVAHAYLFSGPRHLGKFTITRWFAAQLFKKDQPVEKHKEIEDQMERMIHPDFLVMDKLWVEEVDEDWAMISQYSNVPQEWRAKAPKARTDAIGIEEVRALHEKLSQTGGSVRCCLIRSIERMHDAAANAFLKILEEPPSSVVFILTTQAEASLLPTIISRTRMIKFAPLQLRALSPLVQDLPRDEQSLVLHLCGGAPGQAIDLKNNPDQLRQEKQMHAAARQLWMAGSAQQRLSAISEYIGKSDAFERRFLLHLGLTLAETENTKLKYDQYQAYAQLVEGLQTNAHRMLLAQRFALALG